MNQTVLLGLSGGVDSAVAACLLRAQGFTVLGHWLDIGLGGREAAEEVAQSIGIPFSAGDIRTALAEQVMAPFTQDYLSGRTPLPCALCNPTVKFPALFQAAEAAGAHWVATGHYARILTGPDGAPCLYRGLPKNDQAYMLARLPRTLLSRIRFPLGDYEKPQIRALAADFGLLVADKPDSMEICFIPDGDYAAWLDARGATLPPGNFVTREGAVLGRHRGLHHYTIGQRRGLGLPAAHRLFVSELRPATNEVVLSDGSDLMAHQVVCSAFRLLAPADGPLTVRLRHSKTETPITLSLEGGRATLSLSLPARAPTPGQLAVVYQGDLVVGSGWIESAQRILGEDPANGL